MICFSQTETMDMEILIYHITSYQLLLLEILETIMMYYVQVGKIEFLYTQKKNMYFQLVVIENSKNPKT